MFKNMTPSCPKRMPLDSKDATCLLPYYAGYSNSFVDSVLSSLDLKDHHVIFDPWNGCGTTTTVSTRLGFKSIGFDLNPAMVIVAKAQLISHRDKSSLFPIACDIAKKTNDETTVLIKKNDPLLNWIAPGSAKYVRKIEQCIQKLLVDESNYEFMSQESGLCNVSSLACFYYVCLFRATRRLFNGFLSSNPTWYKKPKSKLNRLRPSKEQIISNFVSEARLMIESLHYIENTPDISPESMLKVASSLSMPLPDGSVDVVLTSPPYCTRIDYAIATIPELCVLGVSSDKFEEMRRKLIGTPTITGQGWLDDKELGETCSSFLHEITMHQSKASKTYYLKNHIQYFEALLQSISEIGRVTRKGGGCVLVVQDSYYKDVHNNLAQIVVEMASKNNLSLCKRFDFPSRRSMALLNNATKTYRKSIEFVESVLCFTRQGIAVN